MHLLRKTAIVGLSVVTAVGLSGGVFVSHGQSVADLQAQITSLLALIQQLQAQLTTVSGGGTVVTTSCTFTRSLTLDSTGADVKCLQQYLNASGNQLAASGVGSVGNETNYFGPLTQAATAKWQAANGVAPAVGYFGPISQAKYTSLAGTVVSGGGTVVTGPVPAEGIVLRLAATNPTATNIPQGAAGVEFMVFEVAGHGTLNSLTFERTGLGQTNDFGSVYLYEGANRLTSGKTINSTTHQVFFPALSMDIDGVKTLTLVADISSSLADSGNVNSFKLITGTGSPTPAGAPLLGNSLTFTGASVGSVTVDDAAAASNPRIGQKAATLIEFTLNAGSSEDLNVHRIALTEGGTINNSYLTNFELRQGDTVLATASGIGARELVVFELADPFKVEKGQIKTFRVYGDISGSARADDTIVFYVDSSSDIYALGATYGYAVTPTISAFDATGDSDTLTVQGGQVTITFNGPATGDLALRAQDVSIFDFTIAAQNDIEIRNTRFTNSVTSAAGGFDDFKVWDVDAGQVVSSALDVTSSSNTSITFTDTINLSAGDSKRFKVTVDVDSNSVSSDNITVTLAAFETNDIRNLENNTYVAVADIVGDPVTGNAQTVQIPAFDIQLSAIPAIQTYVQGAQNVDMVGISLRAVADDIKLTSMQLIASSSVGTLTSGELQSLKLYVDGVQIGDTEALNSSLQLTFDNLNYTIAKGTTKVFTVKGNISASATDTDRYHIYLNDLDDVTAYDSDGNTLTEAASGLTGTTANSGTTVYAIVTTTGNLAVARAADDTQSEAGILVADGTEQVLAKFRFTATNEAMSLRDIDLLVNNDNSSGTATTTAAADEVPTIKLYNGATLLGTYSVIGSGINSGKVLVRDLTGFTVPKDDSLVLTVKGVINTIANAADTGAEVAVHVLTGNFKAVGSTNNDTSLAAGASGREKVVYKTKPTLSVSKPVGSILATGAVKVLRLVVAADDNEDVAWRKVQLYVAVTDATMTGGTTSNVFIRDISAGSNLSLATVHSATATDGTGANNLAGGATGYVSITLTSEQVISAGTSKNYDISLTFTDVDAGGQGGQSISANLHQQASARANSSTQTLIEGTSDGEPSFIWSDWSNTGHDLTTADWSNGYYVKTLPSDIVTIIGG